MKLNAKQLRKNKPKIKELNKLKRYPIYFVLDEIYDTFNIGSIFRLADAVNITKVYLCGKMEYPPSSRIHRAAVGTENWVSWEHYDSITEVIEKLKKDNVQIISVEQNKNSIDYRKLSKENIKFPIALVLGNETQGVKKEVLKRSDLIIELPMLGINKSFNVWGSAAVIAYKILEYL